MSQHGPLACKPVDVRSGTMCVAVMPGVMYKCKAILPLEEVIGWSVSQCALHGDANLKAEAGESLLIVIMLTCAAYQH